MTTRRGFLGAMLAAAAAPAFVRAGSLMPIYVPKPQILTLWGDGVHDDTDALQSLLGGAAVMFGGAVLQERGGVVRLPSGTFHMVSRPLTLERGRVYDGAHSRIKATHDGPMLVIPEAKDDRSVTVANWWFDRAADRSGVGVLVEPPIA